MAQLPTNGQDIYASQDGLKVYTSPDTSSVLWEYNKQYTYDHRPYKRLDKVGKYLSEVDGANGKKFLRISSFYFDDGGFFGQWHTLWRDVYVPTDSSGWITEAELGQAQDAFGIEDLKQTLEKRYYPLWDKVNMPHPVDFYRGQDENGADTLLMRWPNGYTIDLASLSKLPLSTIQTLTSPTKVGDPAGGSKTPTPPPPSPKNKLVLYSIMAGGSFLLMLVVFFITKRARTAVTPA